MRSPAPVAKKIDGRSDSSGDSSSKDFDIIENIGAVTDLEDKDKKKKAAVDDPSDSSASTITEEEQEAPETDGGPDRVVEE